MKKTINDIEIESIQFVNNKNDIIVSLIKNQGSSIIAKQKILFENILAMEMLFDVDQEVPFLPYSLLEINIEQVNLAESNKLPKFAQKRRDWENYNNAFLVLCSGDIELNLICEKVSETN